MNCTNFKNFAALLIFLLMSNIAYNQKYNTAIGFRFGNDLAVSLEQRIFDNYSLQLEHQDAVFTDEKNTSLIFKRHYGILGKRFNFTLGGGLGYHQELVYNDTNFGYASPAALFSVGGEFTIGRLNIIYDFMPGYQFGQEVPGTRFYTYGGIGLRYVIWERPKKSKQVFEDIAFWKKDKNKKSKNKNGNKSTNKNQKK